MEGDVHAADESGAGGQHDVASVLHDISVEEIFHFNNQSNAPGSTAASPSFSS